MSLGKELYKIATRFYPPIAFEMGYLSQVKRMPEMFGFGMSNIVVRFDGKKMDVFRVREDMDGMRDPAIAFALTPAFADSVSMFEERVRLFIALAADDTADPMKVVETMGELYPYSVISFFLTGAWEEFLPEDKKLEIIATCMRYREPADHMMTAYIGFFERYMQKKEIPSLAPLSVLLGEDSSVYTWMEKGFIFSDCAFSSEDWEEFLQRRGYVHQEDVVAIDVHECRGKPAHGGVVQGTVRVVWSPRDIAAFREGDILVASMTTPLFLSAARLASAIVTDEGGITCHAAIIARELKKPCVIGTKVATQVFKDGDMVEVDAEKGIVRLISKQVVDNF